MTQLLPRLGRDWGAVARYTYEQPHLNSTTLPFIREFSFFKSLERKRYPWGSLKIVIIQVFDPLAPPLPHCKNVDAYNDDGYSDIIVLMFKKMNDKGNIKPFRYMISTTTISPVIEFKRQG